MTARTLEQPALPGTPENSQSMKTLDPVEQMRNRIGEKKFQNLGDVRRLLANPERDNANNT